MRGSRIAEALLRGFIVDPDLEEAILGDLLEEGNERAGWPGAGPASAWYWEQALRSVPHLLREWWLQQGPARAVRNLGRVALVQLLAVSLAAPTFVRISTGGGAGAPGQPIEGDPHTLAISVLLAGAVSAAGGLFLAWRASRAPMCPAALLGLSWLPTTLVASLIFPSHGTPTWVLGVVPTLLLALTLTGGGIATVLRGTGHRKHDPLTGSDTSTLEEAMENDRLPYRLAARPLLAAAFILTVPLVAMQLTDEVVWTLGDFVVMGALVFGTGVLFELARMKTKNTAYRAAAGTALATAFLLVWGNLAVGVIGASGNPANLMYAGVLAVGIGGAVGAGFEPRGMARALVATALAQVVVGGIALIAGLGSAWDVLGLTAMFTALWGGSAWLFRYAARTRAPADPAPAG